MLASLGLFGGTSALGFGNGEKEKAKKAKPKPRKKKTMPAEYTQPVRRSSRRSAPVDYSDPAEVAAAAAAAQALEEAAAAPPPRMPPIGEAFKSITGGSHSAAFASQSHLLGSGVVSLYYG